ncbi:MAG: SusC/RagA family TonB-linked outer membrane protein, partial [Bacteroidales bacterium]|nr:SusC/RagA family TonB-linked outer membrane protein [Bacteroidales bacterium]
DAIKFKSSIGLDLAYWGNHGYSEQYFLTSRNNSYDTVTETTAKTNYGSSVSQELNNSFAWQVENIITYDKNFGPHGINVVLGQSAYKTSSSNVGASAKGIKYPGDDWKISVNNTLGNQKDGDRNGWGSWNSIPYSLISYFARVSYNYDERYMGEVTLRRDASSRFGPSNKWGTFPSISLGWNARNEAFLSDIDWLSALKIRASYGVNGNDGIGDFRYAVYASSGNDYSFGSGANGTETLNHGTKPSGLANPDIKWEESAQTDLGIDFGFLGSRITGAIDFYNKKTRGMLLDMPVPSYAGDSAPVGNLGNMVNRGVEIDLGYRGLIGDLAYRITANVSHNHNELTYLGDDATYLSVDSHKIGTLSRGEVGKPFPYFYGYKVDGVFQNQAEVDAYVNADGVPLQPDAKPGDFRFKDINGDGVLDDDNDRTYLGKGMPDWTFGLTLALEWRGFDFNMLLQGQYGAQIFNVARRTDLNYINLPSKMLNRWTGEGSTNEYPAFSFNDANLNNRPSDYWIEDAAFLRARNIQIGYTLPSRLTAIAGISRLRIFGQVENAFTLTRYTGCDPEVTGGNSGYGTSAGIDRGVYPQSRVLTLGVNLNF